MLGRFLNNNWVAGIGAGLVVFVLTSGLVGKVDRTTLALAALAALLAAAAAWAWSDNRRLRRENARLSGMPQFDPASGFLYWATDTSREHPLCPVCSSGGRGVPVERLQNGVYVCTDRNCGFSKDGPLTSASS